MPVSLNVAEDKKFIGFVSDSMLPLALKETLLSFGVGMEEYLKYFYII